MAQDFDAVSLDVGGVLVVPDHGFLAAALSRLGTTFDRAQFGVAHYRAMAAVDAAVSEPEDFTDYLHGFLAAVSVPEADRIRAHDELAALLATPLWCQPIPGSRAGVAALAAAGVPLAVTSNSDGTIADHLRRHEWLQVGDGPGAPVTVVTDSGVVGVGKPHPDMWAATVHGLGMAPERILHVGDSVVYDVDGAAAHGLQSLHFDPYAICPSTAHRHIRTLTELLSLS
ncbi:MAG TPA: HAD family hydrolase [Acidimicrobiales bacterium]|jgi:putative hydrolase of the HAD superfamily|nr:HAD family hydrolase [Acidimicrobiales bacterium]